MGESSKGSMMEEGQNHPKNTDKRIKIEELMEKGGDDKISALPDCVLHEILSRLPSTKYAIRTGTLSKRWTHLWTWVPTLILKLSYDPYRSLENPNLISDFVLSVSKTITQCRQLKKFKVDTFYDMEFEVQYNNWIRHAINCNIEEVDLNFRSLGREFGFEKEFPSFEEDLWLDQSKFFINSCFTDLRLSGLALNPSGEISWKNLRSLRISSKNLNEDLIVNILSGSPLLENLCLEYDYEMTVESDVESEDEFEDLYTSQWPELKHLKKFKVSAVCHNLFASQVKSWIRYVIKCNVKNICISLWLDDRSEYELPIDEIIFTSSCVTDLRLDRCTVNPVGAISWKNLTNLRISNCCLNDDMIENILSGSPILETLVLDGCFGYTRLDITSNSVKNLVLSGPMGSFSNSEPKDAIEVNAPNILSLTIQHQMIMRKLLLVNVSSLVKANLNYEFRNIWFHGKPMPMEVEEMLKNHMVNLGHVKELKIGDLCYKALSCLRDKGFVFPSNVRFPDQLSVR